MTKRIWAGLLALGMALTALPFGIYAEETAWEEEANASEETLDGGLDESAEEFADGLPDYIPEPETDVVDGAADDESADELSEQEESLTEEATPDLPDFIPEEELPALDEEEPQDVQAGDFVWVTPNTHVYLEIDETATNDDDGEWYDGNFVNEANVYVEQARQDAQGRTWLLVRYLYGAEEPNGEMAWTDTATVWVLSEETWPSDAADYDGKAAVELLGYAPAQEMGNVLVYLSVENLSASTLPVGASYLQSREVCTLGELYSMGTGVTAVCDGKPVRCGSFAAPLYGENAADASVFTLNLTAGRGALLHCFCAVPDNWQTLELTYHPDFAAGRSVAFTVNRSTDRAVLGVVPTSPAEVGSVVDL